MARMSQVKQYNEEALMPSPGVMASGVRSDHSGAKDLGPI